MKLQIIDPVEIKFDGEVTSVTLPGADGSFTVLNNHAPIISTLEKGVISYMKDGVKNEIPVSGGISEVHNNNIIVCVR